MKPPLSMRGFYWILAEINSDLINFCLLLQKKIDRCSFKFKQYLTSVNVHGERLLCRSNACYTRRAYYRKYNTIYRSYSQWDDSCDEQWSKIDRAMPNGNKRDTLFFILFFFLLSILHGIYKMTIRLLNSIWNPRTESIIRFSTKVQYQT